MPTPDKSYFDFVRPLRQNWTLPERALDLETMWKTLGMLVLIGALLFLYLAEVSEEATTRAEVERLHSQHLQITRHINDLVLEIAKMQSPQVVLVKARSLGMTHTSNPDYLQVDSLPEKR